MPRPLGVPIGVCEDLGGILGGGVPVYCARSILAVGDPDTLELPPKASSVGRGLPMFMGFVGVGRLAMVVEKSDEKKGKRWKWLKRESGFGGESDCLGVFPRGTEQRGSHVFGRQGNEAAEVLGEAASTIDIACTRRSSFELD